MSDSFQEYIQLLNLILHDAAALGASDVHLKTFSTFTTTPEVCAACRRA